MRTFMRQLHQNVIAQITLLTKKLLPFLTTVFDEYSLSMATRLFTYAKIFLRFTYIITIRTTMETKTISDVTQLATIVILPNIIPIMIDGMDPKVVSAIYRGYFVLSVAVKKQIKPYGIAGKKYSINTNAATRLE